MKGAVLPGEFVDGYTCLPMEQFQAPIWGTSKDTSVCKLCAFNGPTEKTTDECKDHECHGVIWVDKTTYAKFKLAGVKGVMG